MTLFDHTYPIARRPAHPLPDLHLKRSRGQNRAALLLIKPRLGRAALTRPNPRVKMDRAFEVTRPLRCP
jgi:hypothetical protein